MPKGKHHQGKAPPTSGLITSSRIEQWLITKDFAAYKEWVSESKNVADRLEKLTATLTSISKDRSAWSTHVDANKLHTFIGHTIALFNDNLGAVSSNKDAKRIATAVAGFLDCFMELRQEFTFLARFNPAKLFHLLQTLGTKGSLSSPPLASIAGSIGLLIQGNLFQIQTVNNQSGRLETFDKDWESWLDWLEKSCTELALTPDNANRLLTGLATLATTHRLPGPIPTSLINHLLRKLLTQPLASDTVLTGLKQVRILVPQLALTDITALDTDLLSHFMDKAGEAKSTGEHNDLIYANIVENTARIFCEINTVAQPSKSLPPALLCKALQHPSVTTPGPKRSKAAVKILLSLCQILQSCGEDSKKTPELQTAANETLASLNDEKTAAAMSLPDIAHALYSRVISKKRGVWLDNSKTEHLEKEFLKKLQAEEARPTLKPEKLAMAVQQFSEHFCWANPNKPLPPNIISRLRARKPTIKEDSPQHLFVLALKKRPKFQQNYTICVGEKDIEEVLVDNKFPCVDLAFIDKNTRKITVIQTDGLTHRKHKRQDDRQDEYLRALKHPTSGEPLVADIIHIPLNPTTTDEERADYAVERLYGAEKKSDKKAEEQPVVTETTSASAPLPKESKKLEKPQPVISLKPLQSAIDDQRVDSLTRSLKNLTAAGAFKQEQTKAEALLYAVDQFDPNPNILKKLIDTLGVEAITAPTKTGESPLLKAARSGKVKVLTVFIENTKPAQRQNKMDAWEAALHEAQAKNRTGVVKQLTSAGITLPVDKSPVTDRKKPSSAPMLELKQTEEKREPGTHENNEFDVLDCFFGLYREQKDSIRMAQIKTLAYTGNSRAQFFWALQFYDSVKRKPGDEKQYYFWLELSATQNCDLAQSRLALHLVRKAQKSQDPLTAKTLYKKAFDLFKLAAAQGNIEALGNLGVFYNQGISVEKNHEEAFTCFQKAAEQGFALAQVSLGVCYYYGHGVERDTQKAFRCWTLAAEQGLKQGQFSLGGYYSNGYGVTRDFKEAVKWFTLAAKQGYAEAQYQLGRCYFDGLGVDQERAIAVYWFTLAAEKGNIEAQYRLARCYFNGDGVEQDYKEAVRWFTSAAERGHTEAQNILGSCYLNGRGVAKKDSKTAVKWFTSAADQGNHAEAQYSLGLCFFKSDGVDKDEKKGIYYFQKAAEQGLTPAQHALGSCYIKGQGVKPDLLAAMQWFHAAAQQQCPPALATLQDLAPGAYALAVKFAKTDVEKAIQYYQFVAYHPDEAVRIKAQLELVSLSPSQKLHTPATQIAQGVQSGWLQSPIHAQKDAKNAQKKSNDIIVKITGTDVQFQPM